MANTLNLGNGNWATKEDSLLAYNSENGNFKPLPFDFTRASSATVVNKAGLIETVGSGEPRIDFSNDAKGALLLEPQRSNILSYSEDFSQSYWQRYRGSITSNVTTSPDGTLNASRYQEDNQNGGHLFRKNGLSITNELSYTGSIFVKKGELTSVTLQSNSSSRWVASANFDLENGTITSGTGLIENYGNGWYRCSISGEAVQTTGDAGFEIQTSVGVGRDGDGLFMYGAQLEQGSYATSYIPTQGSAVTRVAESNVLATTISLDNDFALFWEGSVFEDDIMLYGGGNLGWYMNYTYTLGRIILDESSGRKIQAYISPSISANVKTKILIRRLNGVHSVFANGIKLTSNISVNSNTNLSLSSMFWSYNSTFLKGLKVNNSQVFKIPLTDSEAIALTS